MKQHSLRGKTGRFEPVEDTEDYATKKARLQESNKVVKVPIARLEKTKKGGNKKKYSPTRMRNEINRYLKRCEDRDEIPTLKDMMLFLKLYPDSFYAYLRYPDYTEIMEQARMIIQSWLEKDVYSTGGMAAGKLKYMQNLHGWADKQETSSTVEQRVITVDEARNKIESLAPRLLELLKNTTVLQQLAMPPEEATIVEKEEKKERRI